MPDTTADRLEREREFHNEAFAQPVRAQAAKFYSITRARDAEFRRRVLPYAQGSGLEYGCGPAKDSLLIPPPPGCEVTAIDLSEVAVEEAQKQAEALGGGVTFQVMDAEHLDFPDGSFDVVVGRGILHHLDLAQAYSEIARVLRPGGRAVFIEPLGHNPLINVYRNRTPALRTVDEHPMVVKDFALAENFFAGVEVRYFHLFSLGAIAFRNTRMFNAVLSATERLDSVVLRIPGVRRLAWYSILELRK